MNEYDSTRMLDLLRERRGYLPAAAEEEADLLLLNTCSIREKAQQKVFGQLGRWRALAHFQLNLWKPVLYEYEQL